jgi:hypothetical protein
MNNHEKDGDKNNDDDDDHFFYEYYLCVMGPKKFPTILHPVFKVPNFWMLHFNQKTDKVQLECHRDDIMPDRICIAKDGQRMLEGNNSLCAEVQEPNEKSNLQNEANFGYLLMFASSSCLHIQHSLTVKLFIIRDCTFKDFLNISCLLLQSQLQ